jgi:hypothetical protein
MESSREGTSVFNKGWGVADSSHIQSVVAKATDEANEERDSRPLRVMLSSPLEGFRKERKAIHPAFALAASSRSCSDRTEEALDELSALGDFSLIDDGARSAECAGGGGICFAPYVGPLGPRRATASHLRASTRAVPDQHVSTSGRDEHPRSSGDESTIARERTGLIYKHSLEDAPMSHFREER